MLHLCIDFSSFSKVIELCVPSTSINPLIPALKLQSNGPSYSDTVIGTLAVGGWAVTFGTARGLGGCGSAQSLLAVSNVTAHPSTASVPITALLYDGPLLCSFNAAIKGLA